MLNHLKTSDELLTFEDLSQRASDLLNRRAPYSMDTTLHPAVIDHIDYNWVIVSILEDLFRGKGMQRKKDALQVFQRELRRLYRRASLGEISPNVRIQIAWSTDPNEQVIHFVVRYNEPGKNPAYSQEIRVPAFRHKPQA